MENSHIADNVSEVIDSARKYIDANIDLLKLTLLERLSKVVSLIISTTLVLLVASLFVLFFSFAAAIFFGHLLHSLESGFLIVSGIYLLLILLFWRLRKKLVINPVIRSLNEILFPENESDEKD